MKVLLSALACEPGRGTELEVGFRAVLAAASRHEVWVLTNADSVPAVEAALEDQPLRRRIHLVGVELPISEEQFARLTVTSFQWHYDRWQRQLAERAVELDHQIDFDVVHHVTLASYWTRTGAAAVGKPLVWGPVGGAVEPPLPLLRELGLRGLVEDALRVPVRRVASRLPRVRRVARDAAVVLAQNRATGRRLHGGRGRLATLSNALAVNVSSRRLAGPRTKDVAFVARLIPWKAPMLALRAMRHVTDPGARLRLFGDGPERRRLERAARRWGLADRVQFEGWVARDALLDEVGRAGVLVHPALHEEAGLCIAEALSLGTPVVALDHGGPAELVRHWPAERWTLVAPARRDRCARALAEAIDGYLAAPPPLPAAPLPPSTSFTETLLDAYEAAAAPAPAPVAWGFPRGKPQMYAETPTVLARGVLSYAFGRRMPRGVQALAAAHVAAPGVRRLIAGPVADFAPVCGWEDWVAIRRRLPGADGNLRWVHFASQWAKRRSSALGLDGAGRAVTYLMVEPTRQVTFHPTGQAGTFRVPALEHRLEHGEWTVRQFQPLPALHRSVGWRPDVLRSLAEEVGAYLTGQVEAPAGAPSHWRAIHGDFTPWNLREARGGDLWLLDWEQVGWGPPAADLLRYAVTYLSMQHDDPAAITRGARRLCRELDADQLREVASFWLERPGWGPLPPAELPRGAEADMARSTREQRAFELLLDAAR